MSVLIQSYDHNTFKTCQTWPSLGKSTPSAKIKFRTGIEPTISCCILVLLCLPPWLLHLWFYALKIPLKEAIFKREGEQIILHGILAFSIAQYWFTLEDRYGFLQFSVYDSENLFDDQFEHPNIWLYSVHLILYR